jgi:hypothetical protein
MTLYPATGFAESPVNEVGEVLVLLALGLCMGFGDEEIKE